MVFYICKNCGQPHNTRFVKCAICREVKRIAQVKRRKNNKTNNKPDESSRLQKTIRNLHYRDRNKNRSSHIGVKLTTDFATWVLAFQKGKCVYCDTKMRQHQLYTDEQLTIERIYDNLPHITSNCVLACWKCNCRERMKPRLEFKKKSCEYVADRQEWIDRMSEHFNMFPPD